MKAIKFLAPLALAASLVAGFTYALNNALSLPEVHKSHSSGKCVKVVTFDEGTPTEKECTETLPDRYTLVWVQ